MYEEWEAISGYPEYAISSCGRVYSYKRRIFLKPFKDGWGYSRVTLFNGNKKITKSIHRLVALTFIPNPLNKLEVNHIDGNKDNNCIDNLEWVTNRENIQHAFFTGLNNRSLYNAGKQKIKVRLLETGETFESISECARYLHCTHSAILHALTKHTRCKGYTIVYS